MEPRPGNVNRPEQVERQARAKIKWLPVAARDARLAVEMALLADRFAQGRLQMPWIDDRVVSPLDGCCGLAAGDVQCAGTMTALAANRAALKERQAIAIDRMWHRLGLVAMTEQAAGLYLPVG